MSVQAFPSTPSKAVATSQSYNKGSKDSELGRGILESKHEGINFEDMVKILFQLDEQEFGNLKAEYSGWGVDKSIDFSDAKCNLENVISSNAKEQQMYPGLMKMGNHVIERAGVGIASGTTLNKIKLLACHDKNIKGGFGDRKPDIVLAPEVDGDSTVASSAKGKRSGAKGPNLNEVTSANISWAHVLLSVEVKRGGAKRSVEEKTPHEDDEDPSKRLRSSTAHSQDKPRASSKTAGGLGTTASARSAISAPQYEVQLATYAAEMQSRNGDRIFSLVLLVRGSKARLYYFHPSVTVASSDVDFLDDFTPLAMLLILYVRTKVGTDGFGFNPHTGYVNPFNTKDSGTRELSGTLTPVLEDGVSFQLNANQRIQKEARIHTAYSLLGRGTAVHEAKLLGHTGPVPELVLKTSWQVKTRASEHVFIEEARKIDRDHIVQVFGWKNVPDIAQTKQLVEKCTSKPKEAYEEKELRILLERKYKPIFDITEPEKFWLAFVQCVKCAHKLYSKGDILHRDISINNLGYYTDESGKEVGVLMDFDLASIGTSEEHKSRLRSGTAPFMAREVLNSQKPYTHKFHHELESFLYVLIWHTLGYSTSQGNYPSGLLDGWRKGTWETIMGAKDHFFSKQRKVIFPNRGSSEGYLHHRCRALSALYSEVELSSGLDSTRAELSSLWDGSEPMPLPTDMVPTVKYQAWLNIVLENDAEMCSDDCCVEVV